MGTLEQFPILRARYDYQSGESFDSNPYSKGSVEYEQWTKKMSKLISEEIKQSYIQGEAEAELEQYINKSE